MDDKLELLITRLREYKSAVIAFSGGMDSTFLSLIARDVYRDNLLLITATSSTYPFYELEEAKSLAELLGIKHKIIVSEEIDIPGYADNPPDRCYYCKSELFGGKDAVVLYCSSGSRSTTVINYLQKVHKMENLYNLALSH